MTIGQRLKQLREKSGLTQEAVAKHLGVELENAHNALSDIKATREVAKKLQQLNVNLI